MLAFSTTILIEAAQSAPGLSGIHSRECDKSNGEIIAGREQFGGSRTVPRSMRSIG
jgi:hypothetical protein